MELLGIELRDKERDADEIKTYKLILKRFGDGNLAAKARDKIGITYQVQINIMIYDTYLPKMRE